MTGILLPNLSLPFLTIFLASPAHSHGAFGLVGGGITIPYHVSILGQTRGPITFTNHYHREQGLAMTEYYVGLELVVCGAVDEGDVVPFFIG